MEALGAMLGPAQFRLPDGDVQPFAVAPWSDDSGPAFDALPRVIQRLRGEWPCVPFGLPDDGQALPPEWRPSGPKTVLDPCLHGFGSNAVWDPVHLAEDSITLSVEYPASHPVRRLWRTVKAEPSRPALSCSLTIDVREACALPIGLHPTFRLSEQPRSSSLEFAGGAARCWTTPVQPQPGVGLLGSETAPSGDQPVEALRRTALIESCGAIRKPPRRVPVRSILKLVEVVGKARSEASERRGQPHE